MADTTRPELLDAIKRSMHQQIRDADGEAGKSWHEFFETYNAILYKFAAKVGCPAQSVDDVVPAVWDEVRKRLPEFEYDHARGGFRYWLFRIVKSKTIDEVRRRNRQLKVCFDNFDTSFWCDQEDTDSLAPEDEMERAFREEVARVTLARFLEEAPPREKAVVQCCVVEGLSTAATAERLGSSKPAVRKAAERARVRLQVIAVELFGRENFEP